MEVLNSNQIKNVCLERGVANLGTAVHKIEMCEGGAWLTYNNHDIALKSGQTIELESTTHPTLISPLDGYKQIVFSYEVRQSVDNIESYSVGMSSGLRLRTLATTVLNAFRS